MDLTGYTFFILKTLFNLFQIKKLANENLLFFFQLMVSAILLALKILKLLNYLVIYFL